MQAGERGNTVLALHVLRLVENKHGPTNLDQAQRSLALQPVRRPADDVLGTGECIDGHDHDLQPVRQSELAHLAQVGRIVDVVAIRRIVIQRLEVRFGDPERLVYTLADGDGRDDDDELAQPEAPVQLHHGTQINIGLAGTGLHLDGEVGKPHGDSVCVFERIAIGNVIAEVRERFRYDLQLMVGFDTRSSLNGLKIPEQFILGQVQPVGDRGEGVLVGNDQLAADMELPIEQATRGFDRGELVFLRWVETEFHGASQNLQPALERQIGGQRIVEGGVTADEQVVSRQSERPDRFRAQHVIQTDVEALLPLRIGHTPDVLSVHLVFLDFGGERVTLAQSNLPNDVLRLPAGHERIREGVELFHIRFCVLGFDAGPAADVRFGKPEYAHGEIGRIAVAVGEHRVLVIGEPPCHGTNPMQTELADRRVTAAGRFAAGVEHFG